MDPHCFWRTFLLIPNNSEKPYALSGKVLEKIGLAVIGKGTMSTKERVVQIHYYRMPSYRARSNKPSRPSGRNPPQL